MIAVEIVDILLETGDVPSGDMSPGDMDELIKKSMFNMSWSRKALYATAKDYEGEFLLEFNVSHLGLAGHISFTSTCLVHRDLLISLSVYVTCNNRAASTNWRKVEIKVNQLEGFRAACQKFVRERLPLVWVDGALNKAKLVAQTTLFLKQFRPTPSEKADPAAVEALKALIDQANIPADVLSAAVDTQDELDDGHTSDYAKMTPADVQFWTNWVNSQRPSQESVGAGFDTNGHPGAVDKGSAGVGRRSQVRVCVRCRCVERRFQRSWIFY